LAARPFAAIHVERQADHHACQIALIDQYRQCLAVGTEFAAFQRLARRGKTPAGIAESGADSLRAKVKAQQAAALGQGIAQFERAGGD